MKDKEKKNEHPGECEKKDVLYVFNGMLLSHKKEWKLAFASM